MQKLQNHDEYMVQEASTHSICAWVNKVTCAHGLARMLAECQDPAVATGAFIEAASYSTASIMSTCLSLSHESIALSRCMFELRIAVPLS